MRSVKYVSGSGQTFALNTSHDITMQTCNPWTSRWKYESVANQFGVRLKRFTKDPIQLSITLKFKGSQSDIAANLNNFFSACEKDILETTPGRLYVDDEYLEGYVIERDTAPTKEFYGYQQTFKFFSPYPFWISEETKQFFGGSASSGDGLNYPHDYPYDYLPETLGNVMWTISHYSTSDFKMTIYGPCVNPSVNIAGHIYQVNVTLLSGEYLVIDSRQNTIVKTNSSGVQSNIYRYRSKTSSVFEPIPGGLISVIWSGSFGFDITVYLERSEPRWKE